MRGAYWLRQSEAVASGGVLPTGRALPAAAAGLIECPSETQAWLAEYVIAQINEQRDITSEDALDGIMRWAALPDVAQKQEEESK